MKIITAALLLLSIIGGCSDKSEPRRQTRDDDETRTETSESSTTFVCEKTGIYCKEHLGAKSWASTVSSTCEKNGGAWSKGSCPKDGRYATCTIRYEDRSTISYFYTEPAMVAETAAIVCKDGLWTPPSAAVEVAVPTATAQAAATPAGKPAARPVSASTAPARAPARPAAPPPRADDIY